MRTAAGGDPSVRALFRGARGRLLAALLVTEFAAGVGGLGYSAVLPIAADELDGIALYGAAVTATGVVGIAFMAIGASVHARLGPQAQLWLATAVWLTGAVLTVAAPSMETLIVGLALRGAGGGLLAGLGLGVLSGLYPDPAERERAFGLFAFMWVLPSIVSPAVNGILLSTAGWRAALAWPIVVLLLGRVLVSRSLRSVPWERQVDPTPPRAPWSFVAIAAGLGLAQVAVAGGTPVGVVLAVTALIVVVLIPFRRALRSTVPDAARARQGGWLLSLVCAGYFGVSALVPLLAATYLDPTGVLGAVLVSIAPLLWALVSSAGVGTRIDPRQAFRLAAILFPLSALLLAGWTAFASSEAAAGIVVLACVVVLIGVAMGAVYPKVMTLTFVGFTERGGTTRTHGGVVLNLGEDVGTIVGATVLAGLGALTVDGGGAWVGALSAVSAAALAVGWLAAVRSRFARA